jgi:hypothetical protein
MASNRIPLLIVKTINKLLNKAIPAITSIIEKTGIQNIGQPNVQMPGTCLPSDELREILRIRNGLTDALNAAAKIIKALKLSLNIQSILLTTIRSGLDISKIARLTANAVLLSIPPPIPIPGGQIPAGINILKDLEELLKPIVGITSNNIDFITITLDYANSVIFKLLGMLKSIDVYLAGCGVSSSDLTPTDDYVKQVDQQYTEVQNLLNNVDQNSSEIYKEFLLEIVEEPYSSTVNRRKAVAKNTQGIILLSTPLSFTTDNQTLLSQIKLIIDTNNLKAD